MTCDEACWGDGPYPDLAEYGDVVWVGGLGTDMIYLSGGTFGLLNSYVLTDPAPLIRENPVTAGSSSHVAPGHTEQRQVDLVIRMSGWENPSGTPFTDPVIGCELNYVTLKNSTIRDPSNHAGGASSGVQIFVKRKSGTVLVGRVQFDDSRAEPGRKSRTVILTMTLPQGGLFVDPSPPVLPPV